MHHDVSITKGSLIIVSSHERVSINVASETQPARAHLSPSPVIQFIRCHVLPDWSIAHALAFFPSNKIYHETCKALETKTKAACKGHTDFTWGSTFSSRRINSQLNTERELYQS